MKCPECGYPNLEDSPTCFSCGARIPSARPVQAQEGWLPLMEAPRASPLRSKWKTRLLKRWGIVLLASVILAVAAFLPWGGSYIIDRYLYSPYVVLDFDLLDLLTGGNELIVALCGATLAGFVASIFYPKFVLLPIAALVLLAFYLPQYAMSFLPPTPAPPEEYISYQGLGIGYFLAWLSVLFMGVLALKDFTMRNPLGGEQDTFPSSMVSNRETDLFDWFRRK